jgi:hypothetical protein
VRFCLAFKIKTGVRVCASKASQHPPLAGAAPH